MTQIHPQIMENLKMGSKRKSKKQTRINCKHFDKLYVFLFFLFFVFFFIHHFPLVVTFLNFFLVFKTCIRYNETFILVSSCNF